jgi:serine protease Do
MSRAHRLPFAYPLDQPFEPFKITDPFGLRKAVVPLFCHTPEGRIYGIGTAFHIDGWGNFLTAEHVIDFSRAHLPRGGLDPTKTALLDASKVARPLVFLGMGLAYGQPRVPDWAIASVTYINSITAENDDPMAALRGELGHRIAVDIACLSVHISPAPTIPLSVPVRLNAWSPTIGEQVLAVGFSELNCTQFEEPRLRNLIKEGMYGAYGVITNIFANGRGSSNPTPVFEVEANWKSGMSGGPVFNRQGEVVGIVSRSLEPDGSLRGVGYAAWLSGKPSLPGLVSNLDPMNPGMRVGYGVFCPEPWQFVGMFKKQDDAKRAAASHGQDYLVAYGSQHIDTHDFVHTATSD